jgi:hypothetical protein
MGRGALTFKGEAPKAKKKRKREKHVIAATTAEGDSAAVFVTTTHSEVAQRPISQDAKPQPVQITVGSGKIITSGTVVTGLGTKFEQELAVGDAMIVVLDGKQEMRVVKMRLSDISCGISSAFSSSLVTPHDLSNYSQTHQFEGGSETETRPNPKGTRRIGAVSIWHVSRYKRAGVQRTNRTWKLSHSKGGIGRRQDENRTAIHARQENK